MQLHCSLTPLEAILLLREQYRSEMDCQIIHDSIHARPGWSLEYLLSVGETAVGYGSVAIGGPWKEKPTAYELFVLPDHRRHLLDLCRLFMGTSQAVAIEVQSNDLLSTVLIHACASATTSESILFEDQRTTCFQVDGARFRLATPEEAPESSAEELRWRGVIEVDGAPVASGGVLFHYNRPYGDIYMEVAAPFRRRGMGAFLVQELKRLCHERGFVPAARCNTTNLASQRTLQRAGFTPCGNILVGPVVGDFVE